MKNWILAAFAACLIAIPAKAEEKKPESKPAATEAVTEKAKEDANKEIEKAVNTEEKVDAAEVVAAAGELIGEAKNLFDKGKGEAADQTMSALKWTGIAAAALKLLLMLLKLVAPFFKNGLVIRLACVAVGVAFGIFSYMGLGYEWYNAIIMVLSGPGAILITELQKTIPFLRAKKEA